MYAVIKVIGNTGTVTNTPISRSATPTLTSSPESTQTETPAP